MTKLTIWGHPVVLKNNKQICFNKSTGRRFVKSNPRVEAYQHKAIEQICFQWSNQPPLEGPLHVRIIACGAWRSDSGNIPDLSNLYQMPEDLLEAAGVIVNDRQIVSHDGSRRVCLCDGPCPRKEVFKSGPKKGTAKPSCGAVKKCPYERVMILIEAGKWPAATDAAYVVDEF